MELNKLFYSADENDLNRIREKLISYDGGSIECFKNMKFGIAEICINNPDKRNAISGKMMIDFEKILDDVEKWNEAKGIIIYGADGIFCSGGDLNFARNECNSQSGYDMSTFMNKVLNKLLTLPLISAAYINGDGAIGGGAEIVTACDFRLMCQTPNTKVGFVHNKMGIVPAWGGCARLVQIVGKQKALDLILSGNLIGADECVQIGLVDGIVKNYVDALRWLLSRIKYSPDVIRATKLCVLNAAKIKEDVILQETALFAPLWGGPDNISALKMNYKHK